MHRDRGVPKGGFIVRLDVQDVLHVAYLARLHLGGGDVERFCRELGVILDYMGMLDEVSVAGVQPTVCVHASVNVFRDDRQRPCLEPADALANAPAVHDDAFDVPLTVEEV